MSEIADYINQTGPAVVAAQLRASPDYRVLNMMWKSPADLIPLTDAMGWQTIAEVQAWVTASLTLPHPDVFIKQVLAPCSLAMERYFSMPWIPMDTAIAEQCNRAPDFWRSNSDKFYRVQDLVQLQRIAQECWSHRFGSHGEELDCDDFVNIARGWLSANGLGDIAAGKCIFRMYNENELLAGHSVLLCLTKEYATGPLTCHWWEPQDGKIYPISFTKFQGRDDCTRVEIFMCDF